MLTQADFKKLLVATLTDSDVIELYNAHHPSVVQQIDAISLFLSAMSKELDISEIEPFIKTRNRSIIADATNKGILPIGTACQHTIQIKNNGTSRVSLSQGRVITDNAGSRPWRLMSSVTIEPKSVNTVIVEQSEYREVSYTVPLTEIFHKTQIALQENMYLCAISMRDDTVPIANQYQLTHRFMNALPGDYIYNVTMDSFQRLFIQFGDTKRAGITAENGQVFTIGITETYGEVDPSTLADASLLEVLSTNEQKLILRFVATGLIKSGADPLTVDQLRTISSYPSLYDESAVFLGNFDFLIRQKFMTTTNYLAVWNENVQQRFYSTTYKDINHLNLAVVAKDSENQDVLISNIKENIANADSLFLNRVNVKIVEEVPYIIEITGRLGSLHDLDSVNAQIKSLLISKYGKGQLASSRWLQNGFNIQEISTLLRNNIPAFQDRISDFSINPTSRVNKPHEWIYMTEDSIQINLSKTAESVGSTWGVL